MPGDIPDATQSGSAHRRDQPGGQDEILILMSDDGVQLPDGRIVGKKRNDDDRGIRRQEVAFDNHHQDTTMFSYVEAAQLFHDASPGDVMMSANG